MLLQLHEFNNDRLVDSRDAEMRRAWRFWLSSHTPRDPTKQTGQLVTFIVLTKSLYWAHTLDLHFFFFRVEGCADGAAVLVAKRVVVKMGDSPPATLPDADWMLERFASPLQYPAAYASGLFCR